MHLSKRLFDILVSATFLVILSPAIIIISAAIKLSSRGPVIYRQERIGLCYSRFTIYKFRSMYEEERNWSLVNMSNGPVFKMKDDPRVTPVGKLIRKSCLDEIPQLFNVLKGDMSIVGPRPLMPDHMKSAIRKQPGYERRLSVKPGITSLWQINGWYDSTFEEWVNLDLKYVDQSSIWLDTKILLKSFFVALKGIGW